METKLLQPLRELPQVSLRIIEAFETHHPVIRIAPEEHLTLAVLAYHLLDPLVLDEVQIEAFLKKPGYLTA